jgi:hypothetical protein
MDNIGNGFYDIGCHVADQLDRHVLCGNIGIREAYWMFERFNMYAGSRP